MSLGRILVVEDDIAIRRGIVDALKIDGYDVLEASDGHEGMEKAISAHIDLILLDLVIPGPGGLDILKDVKETRPTMPVIILTAMGDEDDRIKGLKLGADDYVVKPFSLKELIARVEAVLRRSAERPSDITEINVPGGRVNFDAATLTYDDGQTCDLSEKELDLLRYLAQHSGRTISRDEILQRVWRLHAKNVSTRTIDMHVARLREKLRDNSSDPKILITVRGKGYRYEA